MYSETFILLFFFFCTHHLWSVTVARIALERTLRERNSFKEEKRKIFHKNCFRIIVWLNRQSQVLLHNKHEN